MIAGKTIKPSKLKVDAVRLELLNELRAVGRKMQADFEATVAEWSDENKPEFETLISLTGGEAAVVVEVESNGEIYRYVNEGTDPHPIRAKSGKALAFAGVYRAKTQPGVIGSRSGGASGEMVYRREVQHPGTEARRFDVTIARKWNKAFKRRMEAALKRAVRASGHGS